MARKKFWEFKNSTSGVVELMLYGEIQSERSWLGNDGGIYADEFVQELNALGAVNQINCRINSVGGDIFAAVAIYTQLKTNPAKVVAIIDGLSASAATLIMMAADEIQMPTGSMLMIHDPLTTLCGMYQADELTEQVNTLNTIKDSIIEIYAARTGTSKSKIDTLMADTTWMTADDAIKLGFADTKIDGQIDAQMKGKILIMNKIKHDLSGLDVMPELEHAKKITNAITTANTGNSIIAQFVAVTSKKGAKDIDSDDDDPDNDDDNDNDNDDDVDGKDAKAKNKAKAKVKDDVDDDIDDDVDDEDTKDKKAKKAIKNLINKYPNTVNRIINQAKAEERERIQQIDNISNQVNPTLSAKAKYTDCTTAKDLLYENAIKSQAQSKAKASAYLNSFAANTAASGVKNVGAAPNAFSEVSDEETRSTIGSAIANFANKAIGRR